MQREKERESKRVTDIVRELVSKRRNRKTRKKLYSLTNNSLSKVMNSTK